MPVLSVVIPALNEAKNVETVIEGVPVSQLRATGWDTEIIVVDNNSTDGTGDIARAAGARVIHQPRRGYGSAYKAGFAAARGEIIVTADADQTYPLDHVPGLLSSFCETNTEFLTTNRLLASNRRSMKFSHRVGNGVLSTVARILFRHDLKDSQSGMWMFRRYIWPELRVTADGMAFSQEIKNEAFLRGFRIAEVPIEYRPRGGEVKLNAIRDGMRNLSHLMTHRIRRTGPKVEHPKTWTEVAAIPGPEGTVQLPHPTPAQNQH